MRNRHPGPCYFCGKTVEVKNGHFERDGFIAPGVVRWKLIHAECVFVQRRQKEQALFKPAT